jgi:hypothetical protein
VKEYKHVYIPMTLFSSFGYLECICQSEIELMDINTGRGAFRKPDSTVLWE